MSDYNKTVWQDSPETEITAERLNNMEEGIYKAHELLEILSERSHVGMVIHTTTLDTMEKVVAIYGGTTWKKIEGMFLLGASSKYAVNSTGGEETHVLTINEMPPHTHNISSYRNYEGTGSETDGTKLGRTIQNADGGNDDVKSISTGGGNAHNNMPPYKAVYIWERVE